MSDEICIIQLTRFLSVNVFYNWIARLRLFVFFLMFITGPSWGANSIQITELEYRLLESVAEKILKDFPPAKYYYVGVGRSPSALIAYLEAIARAPRVTCRCPKQSGLIRLVLLQKGSL